GDLRGGDGRAADGCRLEPVRRPLPARGAAGASGLGGVQGRPVRPTPPDSARRRAYLDDPRRSVDGDRPRAVPDRPRHRLRALRARVATARFHKGGAGRRDRRCPGRIAGGRRGGRDPM
ncbi:MAG: hypothetical protein AVDCRST_MAG19-4428, partial [uncultured Thermomicrobiales bacterium]